MVSITLAKAQFTSKEDGGKAASQPLYNAVQTSLADFYFVILLKR